MAETSSWKISDRAAVPDVACSCGALLQSITVISCGLQMTESKRARFSSGVSVLFH